MSGWHVSSAEVRGKGHRRSGLPCQDKTANGAMGGVRVAALADGAGYARFGHFGAETVVRRLVDCVAMNFTNLYEASDMEFRENVVHECREALQRQAANLDCDVQELASTLQIVAVKKRRYLAVHIGDGIIGCYRHKHLEVLSEPANGEYSNQTWFTTSDDVGHVIRVYRGDARAVSGFILMSDGAGASLYDNRSKSLAPAVMSLLYHNALIPEARMSLLLEESIEKSICSRTDDDCSIILLSRIRQKHATDYEPFLRRMVRKAARRREINAGHQ